jgi:endonuclease YncB( thermonuclease family)
MKSPLFWWGTIFAAITAFVANPVHAAIYTVSKVTSGETIDLDDGGKINRARLVGIDSPEPSQDPLEREQPFAASARNYLAIQVLNRTVTVKTYGLDAEGFLLVELYVGDRSINLAMIRAGFAEAYLQAGIGFPQFDLYRKAQDEAKRDRRGMWLQGNNYLSPREWRRGLAK